MLTVLLASAGMCLGLLAATSEGANHAQPAAHRRQKRDWIWNQMHIDEEKNTSLPHYVGKVRLSSRAEVASAVTVVVELVAGIVAGVGAGTMAVRGMWQSW